RRLDGESRAVARRPEHRIPAERPEQYGRLDQGCRTRRIDAIDLRRGIGQLSVVVSGWQARGIQLESHRHVRLVSETGQWIRRRRNAARNAEPEAAPGLVTGRTVSAVLRDFS